MFLVNGSEISYLMRKTFKASELQNWKITKRSAFGHLRSSSFRIIFQILDNGKFITTRLFKICPVCSCKAIKQRTRRFQYWTVNNVHTPGASGSNPIQAELNAVKNLESPQNKPIRYIVRTPKTPAGPRRGTGAERSCQLMTGPQNSLTLTVSIVSYR